MGKNESLLLQVSNESAPDAAEKPGLTLRFDGASAKFDENFLTVDTLQWSEDGKNYSQPLLCNELNTLLL